ncbi:uroporphyrinogen decarboxylase [Alkalibaculum sporogenes]|uniref:uroporphyrinogen decarboxylase n=1 Tax=Alkalibaculum sporogenes TaxID=2655001 RepID=UPI00128BC0EF|nr:uroporphyrinogen decarboxylase [Alkalibaculum sporogenes]
MENIENTRGIKELQVERKENIQAVYDNLVPRRVPINVSLGLDIVAEYAGIDRRESLWDPLLVESAADELCDRIFSDVCVYGGKIHMPSYYQAMGSKNCVMSSTGFMQHPNTVGLLAEEYDDFINNPFDCIIEKVLPRNYKDLNFLEDPARSMFTIAQAMMAKNKNMAKTVGMIRRLTEKYGYPVNEPGTGGGVYAPMDILTDNLRSFSGMSSDIRRVPSKVKEAVEALYPLNYKVGIPPKITNYGNVFFPLHMPTFMREKDFSTLWWPTWFRQVNDYASMGLHSRVFCEHDWMRYLDYIQDLPTDTRIQFEYGDAKKIKEKLGNKFILTCLFPLSVLTTCTKQECIDKTKEFIDIMAPGGKFIFGFDKSSLVLSDINIENLVAVCETVRDYGVYSNPGDKAGLSFHKEDYKHSEVKPFESKYYRTFEEYKRQNPETPEMAKNTVMELEDAIVSFIYSLCQ